MGELEFHMDGWDTVVRQVIDDMAVPMAQAVADACNIEAEEEAPSPPGKSHFMVSVQGTEKLRLDDYRATVITASAYAMRKNAKDNVLLRNFNRAVR